MRIKILRSRKPVECLEKAASEWDRDPELVEVIMVRGTSTEDPYGSRFALENLGSRVRGQIQPAEAEETVRHRDHGRVFPKDFSNHDSCCFSQEMLDGSLVLKL